MRRKTNMLMETVVKFDDDDGTIYLQISLRKNDVKPEPDEIKVEPT